MRFDRTGILLLAGGAIGLYLLISGGVGLGWFDWLPFVETAPSPSD